MNVKSREKFLIAVDDEEDLKFLFEHFFKDQISTGKLNLIFTTSAQTCLDKLANIDGDVVVLSDICMPDMSGIELMKAIFESYPLVKVYLVSAYDEEIYLDDIQKYGAQGYISKPLEFESLKEKVLNILDIVH